jgi:hypothetical protein
MILCLSSTTALETHHPSRYFNLPKMAYNQQLYDWIQEQYLDHAFGRTGFMGWRKFSDLLVQKNPAHEEEIVDALAW